MIQGIKNLLKNKSAQNYSKPVPNDNVRCPDSNPTWIASIRCHMGKLWCSKVFSQQLKSQLVGLTGLLNGHSVQLTSTANWVGTRDNTNQSGSDMWHGCTIGLEVCDWSCLKWANQKVPCGLMGGCHVALLYWPNIL